jgi:hypothetical protein
MILRSRLFVVSVSIIISCCFASESSGIAEPCPAVAEMTLAQKAAQWVTSFQQPYCDYLQTYSALMVKQGSAAGVLQAPGAVNIFRGSGAIGESDGSKALAGISVRIKLKDPTVAGMASAKRRALRAGTAITLYAAGKKAFTMANQLSTSLSCFAPTSFDFASRQQAQKDAAKLAHLRGLVQSQELRLISLAKMLDALAEGR